MTATINAKKDRPNYFVVIRYIDESGKERQKWITTDIPVKGNNKRRAEAKRAEIEAKYKNDKINISKDALFVDFISQWLETLYISKAIVSTTYDGYKLILEGHILPFFKPLKLDVRDITPAHIQKYVNFKLKTLSPNTVIKHLHNISKCLDSAVRQNMIAFNPVSRIDRPKKIRYTGAKHFNEKQIELLLSAVKGDILETVILFGIFYGLRRSEIIGIKWDSIDMDNNVFSIKHTVIRVNKVLHKEDRTKNDSSNSDMPIPDIIKLKLLKIKEEQERYKLLQPNDYVNEGYVFTYADGRVINPNYVTKHFSKLLEDNHLPHIRFHDLRHSSAGYLKALGFDLKDIQTWLRHGDIGTTMNLYVNLDMEAKRGIAENLNNRFKSFKSVTVDKTVDIALNG